MAKASRKTAMSVTAVNSKMNHGGKPMMTMPRTSVAHSSRVNRAVGKSKKASQAGKSQGGLC